MPIELQMMLYATALLFVLIVVQATSGVLAQGLVPMANARDNLPAPKTFQARTKRVVDNHREGLTLFAPIALAAVALNVSTPMTALGAQLFFYARVAHAALYLLGAPMVRPLAWAAGIAGTIMVFLPLMGWA
ncbi:MAG: hypothetical protein GC189_01190 [Alphaproteobacteria bacterium]|nr:hypothetical protein [Alphaproteobacteria bacterium]